MAFGLLGTARSALVYVAVGASFAVPVAMNTDAGLPSVPGLPERAASAADRAPVERAVVGSTAFAMPGEWERMRSADLPNDAASGMCPAGRTNGACTGGFTVTLIAYDGSDDGSSIPGMSTIEGEYDRSLRKRLGGFRKLSWTDETTTAGDRYGVYEFTHRAGRSVRHKILATYRQVDGSGTVVLVDGPGRAIRAHRSDLDRFLAGASSVDA